MGEYTIYIAIGIIVGLIILGAIIFFVIKHRKSNESEKHIEVKKEDINALAAYVQAQKEKAQEEQRLRDLRKSEMKQKLETFKQTKDQLKDKLKAQIDSKEWKPLEAILRSADKGGVGIYILYNKIKDKYYVGQAKQIFKRIRDHFAVEEIARDYIDGDKIQVKFLTANELEADYRLDHIEKTGIEIFDSERAGYNKTTGNI